MQNPKLLSVQLHSQKSTRCSKRINLEATNRENAESLHSKPVLNPQPVKIEILNPVTLLVTQTLPSSSV